MEVPKIGHLLSRLPRVRRFWGYARQGYSDFVNYLCNSLSSFWSIKTVRYRVEGLGSRVNPSALWGGGGGGVRLPGFRV